MKKCHLCEKNTLIPETFDEIHLCKICFIKIGGPLWKRKFETKIDAEKKRCEALELVHKHNAPRDVVFAINNFFAKQISEMKPCDACESIVRNRVFFENSSICKKCFRKINIAAWNENDYDDNDQVETNRKKILKIASKNNFAPEVIQSINKHFDSKIQKGLIATLRNEFGQKLKVFSTHCILTTNSNFDINALPPLHDTKKRDNKYTAKDIVAGFDKTVIKKLSRGKYLDAGIAFATNTCLSHEKRTLQTNSQSKEDFRIVYGDAIIEYSSYKSIQFHRAKDEVIGYFRFSKHSGRKIDADDYIFFFSTNNGKERIYNEIRSSMEARNTSKSDHRASLVYDEEEQAPSPTESYSSPADEILKYKKLLDMGAITQEEYERKKKVLLDI